MGDARLCKFLYQLAYFSDIEKEKLEIAQSLSALVNQAYQTLLNRVSRIEYILELNGHPLEETEQVVDMEFLSEIYQMRERLDDAEDPKEVTELLEELTGLPRSPVFRRY